MPTIKFIHNWNNKLDGQFFTTIRAYTEDRWNYYVREFGNVFDVVLNGKVIKKAELIHTSIDLLANEELNKVVIPWIVKVLDTGIQSSEKQYSLFKRFGIDYGDNAIVLMFREVKEDENIKSNSG